MSIIYNALQKTQRNLGNKQDNNKSSFDIILIIIIFCLLIVISFAYYPKLKKHFSKSVPVVQQTNVTKVTIKKSVTGTSANSNNELEYKGNLTLNGVFLSEQENIAIINNQPMHLGDMVEGKKIVRIELNKVKLQDQNTILILRNVS